VGLWLEQHLGGSETHTCMARGRANLERSQNLRKSDHELVVSRSMNRPGQNFLFRFYHANHH
jgi:hypothetical protein